MDPTKTVYHDENDHPIHVSDFSFGEVLFILTELNKQLKIRPFKAINWVGFAEELHLTEQQVKRLLAHLFYCSKFGLPFFDKFMEVPFEPNFQMSVKIEEDHCLEQPNIVIPNLLVPVIPKENYFESLPSEDKLLVFALKMYKMDFEKVREKYFESKALEYLEYRYESMRKEAILEYKITPDIFQQGAQRGLCDADICFMIQNAAISEEMLNKLKETEK